MAKKNRTEEDWFLRGGERPSTKTPYDEPQVPDDPQDDDPQDDDDETGDNDDIEFEAVMSRYRTVKREARVTVKADCEESAMDKAEELAEDKGDDWDWKDVEGSEDIEDVSADEAEEVF